MTEAELIEHIRQRTPADASLVVGIGDDAAVIRPASGHDLVATTDTLVEDVHFDERFTPEDVGHLALASNLSDLAAMGARPRWVLLSLTLPEGDLSWIDGFLDGFLRLAASEHVVLAGGNLARGPRSITVQALGEVKPGQAVTRQGARPGDLLLVTGTLGDAAAALALGPAAPEALASRLTRPAPRIAAGRALAGSARAMIDLSDGLVADLAALLPPPLGARIELSGLPVSAALRSAVPDPGTRWKLQLDGGSDYELLAAVPPGLGLETLTDEAATDLTVIGEVEAGGEIRCLALDGRARPLDVGGWDHFLSDAHEQA